MNSSMVSVTSQGKEKLIVWGGRSSPGKCSNDVITFDPEERAWGVMETEGFKPLGRHRHTCDVIGNRMWVVGGVLEGDLIDNEDTVLCLDLQEKKWTLVHFGSGDVLNMHSHSCCVDGKKLVVNGGIHRRIPGCEDTINRFFTVTEVDTEEKGCKNSWKRFVWFSVIALN